MTGRKDKYFILLKFQNKTFWCLTTCLFIRNSHKFHNSGHLLDLKTFENRSVQKLVVPWNFLMNYIHHPWTICKGVFWCQLGMNDRTNSSFLIAQLLPIQSNDSIQLNLNIIQSSVAALILAEEVHSDLFLVISFLPFSR